MQPPPILTYLQATFSLVNSMQFSEGCLSRKFIIQAETKKKSRTQRLGGHIEEFKDICRVRRALRHVQRPLQVASATPLQS